MSEPESELPPAIEEEVPREPPGPEETWGQSLQRRYDALLTESVERARELAGLRHENERLKRAVQRADERELDRLTGDNVTKDALVQACRLIASLVKVIGDPDDEDG